MTSKPPRYCEVALPVPLRSTFTYAMPAALDGEGLAGRRVIVPFRNRSIVGLCLGEAAGAPEAARIKEVTALMDRIPALSPKLIELGHWISRYYIAPVGEAFRAMLPPKLKFDPTANTRSQKQAAPIWTSLQAAPKLRTRRAPSCNCCNDWTRPRKEMPPIR